ncbi:hypothetical protein PTKU64_65820 [Paraburkholderia terrae]|uniref:Uncharacterized protein n=1 Tax=Paraburkholderia terrae TaxID=311230 RepID=A0ABN6JPN2_9BURK|nr:hypothetical protein PTKU64_65820 [Paraburkholderia terrae]
MQLVLTSLQFGAARHPNERPAKTAIKMLFMVALLAARLDQNEPIQICTTYVTKSGVDARIGVHVRSSNMDIDTVEWPLSRVTIYTSIVPLRRGRWAPASHGSEG